MEKLTWKEAEPPELPPATFLEKIRGGVRVGGLVAATLIALLIFITGRWLRRRLGRWVTYHFFVARIWARFCLFTFSLKPVVIGEPIRKGGVLLANHVSWTDILALRSTTRINFVSKSEVRAWPGVGFIAEICDTVFIERRRSETKKQQQDLETRIKQDELLCLFPEGTSTDGLRVLPFKSALVSVVFIEGIRENAFVQPVTLNYYAPEGLPPNFYGWWGSMPFESHIWSLAARSQGGRVEVIFHPPVRASDYTDRKQLTADCEAAVRSALPERML